MLGTLKDFGIIDRAQRKVLHLVLLLLSHEFIAKSKSVVTGQAPVTLEWKDVLVSRSTVRFLIPARVPDHSKKRVNSVSYTHLTLPTIYSV